MYSNGSAYCVQLGENENNEKVSSSFLNYKCDVVRLQCKTLHFIHVHVGTL